MYHDFDYRLGRERMGQMRTEVAHNRLEARLSQGPGLKDAVPRKSMAARGATVVMALFR